MRERTKLWLCIAAFLVGAGLVVFVVVMTLNNWDFKKLDTTDYVTENVKPEGSFKNIKISTDDADVRFLPTDDGTFSVEFNLPENYGFSATVADDTLTIRSKDDRSWTERIGIQLKSPVITVFLPGGQYECLTAESDTGDFDIPQNFTFTGIEISTDTGDITCRASSDSYARFETDTGEVSLYDMTASNIEVNTETGKVNLKRCTAYLSVDITTKSGDVSGHFLHDVNCTAETKSGDVKVPGTASGTPCRITTKSGDIEITADAVEPDPNVHHIVTDPQVNPAHIVLNTLVLYPDDARFSIRVKYTDA